MCVRTNKGGLWSNLRTVLGDRYCIKKLQSNSVGESAIVSYVVTELTLAGGQPDLLGDQEH